MFFVVILPHFKQHHNQNEENFTDFGRAVSGRTVGGWGDDYPDYDNRYLNCTWNETTMKVDSTFELCTAINMIAGVSDDWQQLDNGFYMVRGIASRKMLQVSGDNVHLILADDATLNVKHIKLEAGNTLHIHSQLGLNGNIGRLIVNSTKGDYKNDAAIGSASGAYCGTLYVHGGDIQATAFDGAGIGGGEDRDGGDITIYAGTVNASGGDGNGSGIGGGYAGSGGNLTIYGGTVTAQGGKNAAGIGGGEKYGGGGAVGNVTIWGGTVTSTGGSCGAGIGSGMDCDNNFGTVTIWGGTVTADGDDDGAGIGGGKNSDGCTMVINGGIVYATGSSGNGFGAAIGGGKGGKGGNVTIWGGTVNCYLYNRSSDVQIIGHGSDVSSEDSWGTLTLADSVRVKSLVANAMSSPYWVRANQRESACQVDPNNYGVKIEVCPHSGMTFNDADTHSINCEWCNLGGKNVAHRFSDNYCNDCRSLLLFSDQPNSDVIAKHRDKTMENVMIAHSYLLKDGLWNIYCLPFALNGFEGTPFEGATVKQLSSSTYAHGKLTLNMVDADRMDAGKPYLVKWESGDAWINDPVFKNCYIQVKGEGSDVSTQWVDFVGSYDPVYINSDDMSTLRLFPTGEFHRPVTDVVPLSAFEGYFKLKGITVSDVADGENVVINLGNILGDVNGDGMVDVSDVNILINIMLGNDDGSAYDGRQYVNDDSKVDVSDVNIVINIMLGKQ